MTYRVAAVFCLAVSLAGALPCCAQHGGGGGHGGGFSGRSTGRSVGHSFGHSFGHMFGAHSGPHGKGTASGKAFSPPLSGAAMIHGRVVQLPHPRGHFPQPNGSHRPLVVFGFNPRQARFGFAQNSGFGFCTLYGGFPTFDFAGTDFDCLQQGFFFDPFFVGGFFPPPDDDEESNDASDGSSAAADADADAYQNVILEEEPVPTVDKVPHHRRSPREPDTLLQLTDGSMYGLRDYWVMDDRLHYVTNYGGQNCIPLSQIDFAKTNQLNADRGLRFSVAQHSSAH